MPYYIIANKLSIKPIFKREDGELISCPEIGLGDDPEVEEQLSIPYFTKNIEDIVGTYQLKMDGYFYRLVDETKDDLIITIEMVRRLGVPNYKFRVLGFEGILFLPSIKVINQKRQILYSYLHIPKKLPGLERGLKNYLEFGNLSAASFNFGAINYTGDEQVREILSLEGSVDPETGFTRRCKVTDNYRLQLKKEFNFIELFKLIANLIEKKNVFESQLEHARTYAKEVEEPPEERIEEPPEERIEEPPEEKAVEKEVIKEMSVWKKLAEDTRG